MWLVNLIVILIFFLSFLGGFKDGAVRSFFNLIILIISLPLAGLSYHWVAGLLAFLPGENWENFVGFFIAWGIISIILQLIFLLPRKLFQKAWHEGFPFRFVGSLLSLLGAAIGLVVFTLLVLAYPIWGWLEQAVRESGVLAWLVAHFSFVQVLLPDELQRQANMIQAGLLPYSTTCRRQ